MPTCAICLQNRESLKFRTGRLSICRYCVSSLNNSTLTPRDARERWSSTFREGILRKDPHALTWVDRWLDRSAEWILAQRLISPQHVRSSHELKVLRAWRGGLLTLNRAVLNYPSNWLFKGRRLKYWHNYRCALCGDMQHPESELHAHHIIFRSRGGTNGYRNLVPLCIRHHQTQHPEITISATGGEPQVGLPDAWVESDTLVEFTEEATTIMQLPRTFDEATYKLARSVFLSGLEACRRDGQPMREFFKLLYRMFGRNMESYVLRFSADERLDSTLQKKP